MDADALFTYQSIAKVHPGVPIVCKIENCWNVFFLCGDTNYKDENVVNELNNEFTMLGPFAVRAVYVDSLQDKLAVQACYNPNLLRIIRELVVGQAEEELYKEANVSPSHLTFTAVPPQFHGKSYIQLFQRLILKQMAIPLGLYRSSPWGIVRNDALPYVITNPDADLLVQENDFTYTLESKSSMDSILKVKVLRGSKLGLLQKEELYSCKTAVALHFTVRY